MSIGIKMPDGTFTGAIGMMQRNEIDVFLGPASLNEDIFEVAEELYCVITSFRLLTWMPEKVIDPFSFAVAFKLEVWLSLAVTIVTLPLICWILARYFNPWSEVPVDSYFHFLWIVFSRIFPQGDLKRSSVWHRLCMASFMLAISVTFMNYLSSELTSLMTLKQSEDFIDEYPDVLRFKQVNIYTEPESFHSSLFSKAKSPLMKALSTRLVTVRGIYQYGPRLSEILQWVLTRKGVICVDAMICRGLMLQNLRRSGRCPKVRCTSGTAGSFGGGILVNRKLAPEIREKLLWSVHVARETFIFEKTFEWLTRHVDQCTNDRSFSAEDATKALTMAELQGAFVVLTIGLGVSLLFFVAETWYIKSKQSRPQERSRLVISGTLTRRVYFN